MKPNSLFSAIACIFLSVGLTAYDSEKDLKIIEGDLPIKTTTLYMVGDATPTGWDIGNPTPLQASGDDALIFNWEGELRTGEVKLCLTGGSWDIPFIRPTFGDCKINLSGVESPDFTYTNNPDDKWKVEESGTYRITFDLENWTISVEHK